MSGAIWEDTGRPARDTPIEVAEVLPAALDPTTRVYTQRRTAEGRTRREIIRCLKRYVTREIHAILTAPTTPTNCPTAT